MINYRYRGLMAHMLVPIIIILAIIRLIFKMTNEYIFIVRVLYISISMLIFILSIIRINNRDLGLLKYFGIGCLFLSIIGFFNLEVSSFTEDISIIITFAQIMTCLELLNSIFSMYLYYKNYSVKIQMFIFIFATMIVYFILKNESRGLNYLSAIYINKLNIINEILICILFIIILCLYKKIGDPQKYKLIIFISYIILLSNFSLIISIVVNRDFLFFTWTSKLLGYFIVYNKFEEDLLCNAYSSAYEKLNRIKEIKKNLNKRLIRREKELKELNLLLEKSDKKYYDVVHAFSKGLLLFENDILTYSNYDEENYYSEEVLGINHILARITGEQYLSEKEVNEFTTEIMVKNKEGEKRILEIYLMKIYGNKKILVFNDITEIFRQREEILNIEKRIAEENIKEEFYSNISHELRTPINLIYSAVQLNDLYIKNNEIDKIDKNNDIITQNCLRLIRTINNFIDSNKLSEGYLDMNCKYYNLVDIIKNIVLHCDFYMKLKETKLTYDIQYKEIYLYCDKNHIERILLNILSNYLKHGGYKGNICIKVKIENNDKVIIEVINDDEAIPEDKIQVIFDKFTKVNNSLNRPSEGSGLGLYLTKRLVELHGGEISISTGKEYNNTFKIVFPYEKCKEKTIPLQSKDIDINKLQKKIDIEFSDIYF